MEGFFRPENHVTRHAVFQFSNIAGPFALMQNVENFLGAPGCFALEAAIELLAQIFDQIRNILTAISEGRERDADYIDAVEKVGAKTAAFDFFREDPVRG